MPPRARALVLVVALASACAARPGPADAVASYTAALREARYGDAYRLLSTETRRMLPYDDFERLARAHPDEVRETVRWLERVDPLAPVTARMDLAGGETVTFVEENGEWRLDPSVLDFYGQRTPRQALRSFVRALARERWDVLLRFVPRRLAEGLTAERLQQSWAQGSEAEEVQRMRRQLEGSLDRPIEVVGNRATMTYGPGGRYMVQFVREDGDWKIEDPE